jgi:ADP-glucose pyrophosphorylase
VINEAVISSSIIMAGAVVESGAIVARSVIGPGAVIAAGSVVVDAVVPARARVDSKRGRMSHSSSPRWQPGVATMGGA